MTKHKKIKRDNPLFLFLNSYNIVNAFKKY